MLLGVQLQVEEKVHQELADIRFGVVGQQRRDFRRGAGHAVGAQGQEPLGEFGGSSFAHAFLLSTQRIVPL